MQGFVLFLQAFQIMYLPDRVLKNEFAILLDANPIIHRYLVSMCPSIGSFIDELFKEYLPAKNGKTLIENCDDLLWEIADLIVYSKYPDMYHANVEFDWETGEIIPIERLEGKIAVDAGAGPGKLAFQIAPFVNSVYAMEPVEGFRKFMRDKANKQNCKNLYPVDGFLDSMPFPDNSIDVLITSSAIGWNLEDELIEIERILKPDAHAIHLFFDPDSEDIKKMHDSLISSKWNYERIEYGDTKVKKLKYQKVIR